MWSLSDFTSTMSGEPATMVEKAVSTLKVRDLLTTTLTRWTSFISLTKTPPEEPRRSAASARSPAPNKGSATPRPITPKARSLPTPLPEMLALPIRAPLLRSAAITANLRTRYPLRVPLRAPRRRAYKPSHYKSLFRISNIIIPHGASLQEETPTATRQCKRKPANVASEHHHRCLLGTIPQRNHARVPVVAPPLHKLPIDFRKTRLDPWDLLSPPYRTPTHSGMVAHHH